MEVCVLQGTVVENRGQWESQVEGVRREGVAEVEKLMDQWRVEKEEEKAAEMERLMDQWREEKAAEVDSMLEKWRVEREAAIQINEHFETELKNLTEIASRAESEHNHQSAMLLEKIEDERQSFARKMSQAESELEKERMNSAEVVRLESELLAARESICAMMSKFAVELEAEKKSSAEEMTKLDNDLEYSLRILSDKISALIEKLEIERVEYTKVVSQLELKVSSERDKVHELEVELERERQTVTQERSQICFGHGERRGRRYGDSLT